MDSISGKECGLIMNNDIVYHTAYGPYSETHSTSYGDVIWTDYPPTFVTTQDIWTETHTFSNFSENSSGTNSVFGEYFIAYPYVIIQDENCSKKYHFSSWIDKPDIINSFINKNSSQLTNYTTSSLAIPDDFSFLRGKLLDLTEYSNNDNSIKRASKMLYNFAGAISTCNISIKTTTEGSRAYKLYTSPCNMIALDKIYDNVDTKTLFQYNSKNFISNEATTNSNHQVDSVQYTYPIDYSIPPYDLMQACNIISPIIEESKYANGIFTSATKTSYANFGANVLGRSLIMPSSIQRKTSGMSNYETRVLYNKYDSVGNPLYILKDDISNIVYLYSYNYQYPVAKIEGLTYDEVKAAVGEEGINSLAANASPTKNEIEQIRTTITASGKTAMVSTYTYAPLIGMVTATDPRGVTTNYTYDTFNRLYLARNDDKKIVAKYSYGYQNNPDNGMGGYSSLQTSITTDSIHYHPGSTIKASIAVSGGSNDFSYRWSLRKGDTELVTGNSISFSCVLAETGSYILQCVVTDNLTALTTEGKQAITCYTNPSITISTNASFYMLNDSGCNTVSVSGGSSDFSYRWTLKNNSGTLLTSTSDNSFCYTCSQSGTLTVECTLIDNVTGQTTTQAKNINCYNSLSAEGVKTDYSSYVVNTSGTATANVSGGSGSYLYKWTITPMANPSTATTQTTNSPTITFKCPQRSQKINIQCIVYDNIITATITESTTVFSALSAFSWQSGFASNTPPLDGSCSISNGKVSFGFAFYPTSAMMKQGTRYLVVNISPQYRPSVTRELFYTASNGRTWYITVDMYGDMYFTIRDGPVPNLPVNTWETFNKLYLSYDL
jgi:hypothetical protein